MREIKYRGKRIDNRELVYGSLIQTNENKVYISLDDYAFQDEDFIGNDLSVRILGKYFQVDPETVGQYTGLKDKNGTEIYEGDIIGTYEDEDKVIDVIKYEDCKYIVHSPTANLTDVDLSDYLSQDIEVIGNIYENPELLD